MKRWRILFYVGNQLYDVMDVVRRHKPIPLAQAMLGVSTRYEIELIDE
jgi:hypothetical protein